MGRLISVCLNEQNGREQVRAAELAGARGRDGCVTHGTGREDRAFRPRETAPNLLLAMGYWPYDRC